jgi:hypothetical protein
MVYGVKCFTHVQCYCDGSFWRFLLVESCSDCVVNGVKSSCCRVLAFESMLRGIVWYGRS